MTSSQRSRQERLVSGFQQLQKFSTTPRRFLSGCEDGCVFAFEGVSESGSGSGLGCVWVGAGVVVVFVFGMQTYALALRSSSAHWKRPVGATFGRPRSMHR